MSQLNGRTHAADLPPPSAVDPSQGARVELARAFAAALLKGVKQISIYRHDAARFPELLHKAHEALTAFTAAHGALAVKVEAQNLLLQGAPLLSEDSPLPYRFYRDGIRQLTFRPGIPAKELVQLALIALSDAEHGEDLVSQLWRSGLSHVEYLVLDGFQLENVPDEQVEVEVDQIVGYLYDRLKTTSDDSLHFARLSAEDLNAELDGVEQLRGVVVKGTSAGDALKAKLQRELEEEEGRLFPKLVMAVFQVVESGIEDPTHLEEMFIQLLDALLLQEDFTTINQVVARLEAMARKGEAPGPERLRATFIAKMGEEQRLLRVAGVLRTAQPRHGADIARYLHHLGPDALVPLLGALESLELPDHRALLCDVLARFAPERPEPFIQRLASDRPQTVRDMVALLEKCHHPDRLKLFGQVMKTPNLAVKLEVLAIIAKGRTGEARKLVAEALNDAHPPVRMLAARLLNHFDKDAALGELVHALHAPGFEKRTPEEKGAFISALGATGLPGAVTELHALLHPKATLFHKAREVEDKLLAIQGLVGAACIQSYKVLQELADDKHQPPEVLTAARKAMHQTRKTLFGDHAPHHEE